MKCHGIALVIEIGMILHIQHVHTVLLDGRVWIYVCAYFTRPCEMAAQTMQTIQYINDGRHILQISQVLTTTDRHSRLR